MHCKVFVNVILKIRRLIVLETVSTLVIKSICLSLSQSPSLMSKPVKTGHDS